MKKVAFIANIYHNKSESSNYIIEILKERFKVDRISVETWVGLDSLTIQYINKNKYDIIVFWQNYPEPKMLEKLEQKNIVWIPMFDTEMNKKFTRYTRLIKNKIKIVSFSKKLYRSLSWYGFDIEYAQLYIKPLKRKNFNNKKIKVFYWPRMEVINWEIVKKLLGNNFKGEVIIQNVPDPNNTFKIPNKSDIKKYNIEIIDKWLPFDQIMHIRSSMDLFIAPRLYEGIGLTFLEAMAGGTAVVSPNNSTMNEYITDKVNGYLYNPEKEISPIDFSNIEDIKDNAYKSMEDGYKRWDINKKKFLSFCNRRWKKSPVIYFRITQIFYLLLDMLLTFIKKML